MRLNKGSVLQKGKYVIESVLGQGSFGITYLATTKFQGPLGDISVKVAIKEFFARDLNLRHPDGTVEEVSSGSLSGKYAKDFQREAKNLSSLKHPNIINVLEAFSENNTHYYVMEYLDRGNLDDYIQSKERLSEFEALDIASQISSALSYMHSHKMLHLDLKPKNVMRRSDGSVCLIDFGLSKQYESSGEPESSTTIGLGTPGYAPLEQGSSDERMNFAPTLDIYALGASIFKMLTGKTPPRASDIMNDGFPSEELDTLGVSPETIAKVERMMSPRRKDRPQSVSDCLPKSETSPYKNGRMSDSDETFITDEETLYKDSSSDNTPIELNFAHVDGRMFLLRSNNGSTDVVAEYDGDYANYADCLLLRQLAEEKLHNSVEIHIAAVPDSLALNKYFDYKTRIGGCRKPMCISSALAIHHMIENGEAETKLLVISQDNTALSLVMFQCGDGIAEYLHSKVIGDLSYLRWLDAYRDNCGAEFIEKYHCSVLAALASFGEDSSECDIYIMTGKMFDGNSLKWYPRCHSKSISYVGKEELFDGLVKYSSSISGESCQYLLLEGVRSGYRIQLSDIGLEWLIEQRELLPLKRIVDVKTSYDNQDLIALRLFEQNELGRTCVADICLPLKQHKPKGEVSVEVSIDIDANSLVKLSVKEQCENATPITLSLDREIMVTTSDRYLPHIKL